MIQEEKKKRQVAVAELEERMKSREAALIEEHDRALRRVEEHFTSTRERLLTDQRTLKVRPVRLQGCDSGGVQWVEHRDTDSRFLHIK